MLPQTIKRFLVGSARSNYRFEETSDLHLPLAAKANVGHLSNAIELRKDR